MNDYWSTITQGNSLYQMGAQSHRIYLLDRMKELNVQSFLDVGCGTGPLYELITKTTTGGYMVDKFSEGEMRRWNFKYKGVDPSQAMIDTCKHHFPEAKWEVEDATNLREPVTSWEAVVLMHSFDYVYNYMQALKEAYRVSRQYVIILTWQPLYFEDRDHALNNSINGQEDVDWRTARLQHFSLPRLVQEAGSVGLKLIEHKYDAEINKEGKTNNFLLFEKVEKI